MHIYQILKKTEQKVGHCLVTSKKFIPISLHGFLISSHDDGFRCEYFFLTSYVNYKKRKKRERKMHRG